MVSLNRAQNREGMGMITITNAWIKRGYTGYDHLIDSQDEANVKAMIGRKFRTVRQAQGAAERAFTACCDKRVAPAHIGLEITLANGETRSL